MKKFIFFAFIIIFFFFSKFSFAQQVIINSNQEKKVSEGPRLETGSVNPMHGGSGLYTFLTILINSREQTPDYVKIFIQKGDGKSKFEGFSMTKGVTSPQGTAYQFTKTFEVKDEGMHEFYFEAKIGNKTIHGPSYGGENCEPGMCAACCGAWGGPKIISTKLIEENKVYLFQKDKDEPIWFFDAGKNWITSTVFSFDEKNFAVADNNQNIYFFDVNSNKPKWTFTGVAKEGSGTGMDKGLVVFSRNGYLAASLKGVVYLFRVDSNQPIWSYPTGMVLNGLVISEDGKYIAAAGRDTNVYLWKTQSSKPAWVHKIEAKGGLLGGSVIISLAMTPDGKYFVVGTSCPDRSVHVFTPSRPEEIFQAKAGSNFPVGSVSISDDGQYFLAGGGGDPEDSYTAILYKMGTSEPVWRFDYSRNPVSEVAISSDAKSCVIGSNMDGLIFNDCSGKNPIWQIKNAGTISAIAFSQDGRLVASGSLTNHVFLLPIDGSKILRDWKIENKVESLDMSASGTYIAVGTGLNRFFSTSAEGVNASGAGGVEDKDAQPQLINLRGSSQQANTIQSSGSGQKSKINWRQLAIIFPAIGFALSALGLAIYYAITKLNLLKRNDEQLLIFNKKIAIILLIIVVLSLLLTLFFFLKSNSAIFVGRKDSVVQPKIETQNKQDSSKVNTNNAPGKYQQGEGGSCGNHVCESSAGETKESCPKDCSAGDKK